MGDGRVETDKELRKETEIERLYQAALAEQDRYNQSLSAQLHKTSGTPTTAGSPTHDELLNHDLDGYDEAALDSMVGALLPPGSGRRILRETTDHERRSRS